MPLSNYALDKFVSQHLTQFTACDAPSLSRELAQAEHWVNNFILHSIFKVSVPAESKPYIFAILRRTQMAMSEYEAGRVEALRYISGDTNRVSIYFRALYHFELVTQILYQAYDYIHQVTEGKLFNKGDGSPIQRLNRIYNVSKHLEHSSIPPGYIHAVWLSNQGVNVSDAMLEWSELATLVKELGEVANCLSNPRVPGQDA